MKKAVFLDRDGVIVEDVNYLVDINAVVFFSGVFDAIKHFNKLGYLVVVVTNQSAVARGKCSEKKVIEINEFIKEELANQGAKVDDMLYCPHHPDFQYKGVTTCLCRKPGTLLVERAIALYNIDSNQSYFVGDKETDILCGQRAGLKTVGVKTGYGCKGSAIIPDFYCDSLVDFSKQL